MAQKSVTSGFLWKTMEQYGVIGTQFILQMFLARILNPEDYGVVAIVIIFVSLSNIFVQSGLGTALIQKKEINEVEISSVFNFSFVIAAFLYILLWILSPYIANYFNMPELKSLLKVASSSIFFNSLNSIQSAILTRELKFKTFFFSSLISLIVSGSIAVVLAIKGFGVWALVFQQVLGCFLTCIVLTYNTRWLPKRHFQLKKISQLLNYGWKVLAVKLVDEIFVQIRTFVIGKTYNSRSLSFYNRGMQFPNLLVKSIDGSLRSVLFPVLSKNQDDPTSIRRLVSTVLSLSTFIVFPLLTLLAFTSPFLIELLLTKKWLGCVPLLQIFCVYFATWPIITCCEQVLYATNKTTTLVKIESIRKILDLFTLFVTVSLGVNYIALGVVVVSLLSIPIYVFSIHKQIDYSIFQILKDISASLFISIASGLAMWVINLDLDIILVLFSKLLIGALAYLFMSSIFNKTVFSNFISQVKRLKH